MHSLINLTIHHAASAQWPTVRTILVLLSLYCLSGCSVIFWSDAVTVYPINSAASQTDYGPRQLSLTAPKPYLGAMQTALEAQGFTISTTEKATWHAELSMEYIEYDCVFTDHFLMDFLLVIRNQEQYPVLSLQQLAADGPCGSVQPGYPSLAQALANSWDGIDHARHPCSWQQRLRRLHGKRGLLAQRVQSHTILCKLPT